MARRKRKTTTATPKAATPVWDGTGPPPTTPSKPQTEPTEGEKE